MRRCFIMVTVWRSGKTLAKPFYVNVATAYLGAKSALLLFHLVFPLTVTAIPALIQRPESMTFPIS